MKVNKLILYTNDKTKTAVWFSDKYKVEGYNKGNAFHTMVTTHTLIRELHAAGAQTDLEELCEGIHLFLSIHGVKL
jgi:hypothetical protein